MNFFLDCKKNWKGYSKNAYGTSNLYVSGLDLFTNLGNAYECARNKSWVIDVVPPNDCWAWTGFYAKTGGIIDGLLLEFTDRYCCDSCNNIYGQCDGVLNAS